MEESTGTVSGKIDGMFFGFPTQWYNVPSIQVETRFVSNIAGELDGIQGWKWNAEHVIVFQTVILQHFQFVTGT